MLGRTKYGNNIREVSGVVTLFPDDVILEVNTSSGACTINLNEIPPSNWNTIYKCYIYDISNNASVNNITINAYPGQTINGQASITIDTNGGAAIIRILGLNRYGATLIGGGGSGCCGIVSTTNANLLTLINNSQVVVGQFYQITDAIFITTYQADQENVPVVVHGISANSVSLDGKGTFLNADYQQVGNYSGVVGFGANKGVWLPSVAIYVAGDVVMWNNLHWVNLTGLNTGANPKNDNVNWSLLSKSVTNGYIQEVDFVTYDVQANTIRSRKDKRNNYVENNFATNVLRLQTFDVFQWGNNKVAYNQVLDNSLIECRNYTNIGGSDLIKEDEVGYFANVLLNNSYILDQTEGGIFGNIKMNHLTNSSKVILSSDFKGVFSDCILEQSSITILTKDIDDVIINSSFFNSSAVIRLTNTLAGYRGNVLKNSDVNMPDMKGTFIENNLTNSTLGILIVQPTGSISNNIISNSRIEGTAIPNVADVNGLIGYNYIEDSVVQIDTTSGDSEIYRNYIQQQSRLSVRSNTGKILYNHVKDSSICEVADNSGEITYNEIVNQSSLNVTSNISIIGAVAPKSTGNRILNKSFITIPVENKGDIYNSIFDQETQIQIATNNADFSNVNFKTIIIQLDTNAGSFSNLSCDIGAITGVLNSFNFQNGDGLRGQYNSIEVELDLSDPLIYDLPTKTLYPPGMIKEFVGKYILKNASGQIIEKINSLSNNWLNEISCDTATVVFTISPIAPLVPYYIVSTLAVPSLTITGRTSPNLADSLVFKSSIGNQVNAVVEPRIYL